jgi:hypothetical protein
MRENLLRHTTHDDLRDLGARDEVPLPLRRLESEVDECPTDLLALDRLPLRQREQRLPCLYMHRVVQLLRRIPCRRTLQELAAGFKQRAIGGEPAAPMGAEAV